MPRQPTVSVPLHEMTDRQIHLHLIGLYQDQVAVLKSLERHMADLNQSIADLEAAVDSINGRFAEQLTSLQSALDAANQAADDSNTALQQALADANNAAAAIEGQVNELNAIGANPDTPPGDGTAPTEPPPAEEPTV